MDEFNNTANENQSTFESAIVAASKLPYCKIDRNLFLLSQLKNKVPKAQLMKALKVGTFQAGISLEILNKAADGVIAAESTKATAVSTIVGIPGGFALIGTVPADLAQYYAHVLRVAQKLAYIYGYKELDVDDATQNILMIFLGVMFGVGTANAALVKLAAANATIIGTRVAAKPFGKSAIYVLAKKILANIGVKVTKASVGKAVTKIVPIIGGVVSGGLTAATFIPMSKRLKKEFVKLAEMTPENFEKAYTEADEILSDYEDLDEA